MDKLRKEEQDGETGARNESGIRRKGRTVRLTDKRRSQRKYEIKVCVCV